MHTPLHYALVAPLALSITACAVSQDSYQDSYEARRQVTEERIISSAKEIVDKAKAESDAKIADYGRRFETWRPQLREYKICNKKASQVVASQPGDPISLAMAARNLCRSQEQDLRRAIYAAYADNPNFGIEALETVRKSAIEDNTGEIVAYRAKAASPTPSRPAEPLATNRSI